MKHEIRACPLCHGQFGGGPEIALRYMETDYEGLVAHCPQCEVDFSVDEMVVLKRKTDTWNSRKWFVYRDGWGYPVRTF